MERLKKSGKIISEESTQIITQFETREGSPKVGNAVEHMRKELKRLKIMNYLAEIWKDIGVTIHYVQNNGRDNRSRCPKWQRDMANRGYRRSDSRPGFRRIGA